MTLEDSSGTATASEETNSQSLSGSETEENTVVIEKIDGGIHHAFIPTFLRSCRERIFGAKRIPLENGRSEITARTSRASLIAALRGIPGVQVVEV